MRKMLEKSEMKDYYDASWVILNRETNKVVLETYNFEILQFVNLKNIMSYPIMTYLGDLNKH